MKIVWLMLMVIIFYACKRDKKTGVFIPDRGGDKIYPVGSSMVGGAFVYCYLKTIDSVQYVIAYGPVNGGIAITKHRDLHK